MSGQAAAPQAPAAPDAPQQPPITFRAEVNYVEVDARVLDAQGKFITTLKPGDFQVFEDGKPQQVTAFSLVNIPVERAERPALRIQADRTRRADQPAGRRRPHLPDRAGRPARQRAALAPREGRGPAVHRAVHGRQRHGRRGLHRRPERREPGLHEQPAPAAEGGGQVHGPQGAVLDAEQDRRGSADARHAAAGRQDRGHRRPGTRLPGAGRARDHQEPRGLPGRHPRPPQGARAVQRGHRLRHQRRLQQRRRDDHHGHDARRDRRGHPRQRRGVRRRSPRPREHGRGGDRGAGVPGRHVARHRPVVVL